MAELLQVFGLSNLCSNPPKTWWVLLDFAQNSHQMGASSWGKSNGQVLWLCVARSLLEIALLWCVHGGDERRKKKRKEERERGCSEGGTVATGKRKKRGVTRND